MSEVTLALGETLYFLEHSKNVLTGMELGQHRYCDLASNCPLAIQVRRIMLEAKVSIEELMELKKQMMAGNPVPPYKVDVPPVTATLELYIGATKPIKVDLTAMGKDELTRAWESKMGEFEEAKRSCNNLGSGLYQTYLREIQKTRSLKTLPQLRFPLIELLKYGVLVNADQTGYLFHFHFIYRPLYAYSNGIRYKLSDKHIAELGRACYLTFYIRDKSIHQPYILDEYGNKLQHYHGDTSDCWGSVKYPRIWDGTLKQLADAKTLLVNSLTTINFDSMMRHDPTGMPRESELKREMKKMGREGGDEEEDGEGEDEEVAATTREAEPPVEIHINPTGWGATRRRRNA